MPTADALDVSDAPRYLTFETAAAHCTAEVPIVEPTAVMREVRQALTEKRYESASHLVVCHAGRFLGIVTIERVLGAPGHSTAESLMDRDAPVVAPGVDQEQAAWQAVRHGESSLSVVDPKGRFIGLIPPYRLLAVLLTEHEEDLSRMAGFLRARRVLG
jgi:magnesium transporter